MDALEAYGKGLAIRQTLVQADPRSSHVAARFGVKP